MQAASCVPHHATFIVQTASRVPHHATHIMQSLTSYVLSSVLVNSLPVRMPERLCFLWRNSPTGHRFVPASAERVAHPPRREPPPAEKIGRLPREAHERVTLDGQGLRLGGFVHHGQHRLTGKHPPERYSPSRTTAVWKARFAAQEVPCARPAAAGTRRRPGVGGRSFPWHALPASGSSPPVMPASVP
jgi:hypothetical protein